MNVEFHFFSNNGREWKKSATRTISGHLRIHSTIANTMLKAWETGKWGKKNHIQNISFSSLKMKVLKMMALKSLISLLSS